MIDSDFSGLDKNTTREYVLAFMVDLKRLEKEIATLQEDEAHWMARIDLASKPQLSELDPTFNTTLKVAAEQKLIDIRAKISLLQQEENSLRSKVDALKTRVRTTQFEDRSIDVDYLVAQLQMQTGEIFNQPTNPDSPANKDFTQAQQDAPQGNDSLPKTELPLIDLENNIKQLNLDKELAALKEKMQGSNSKKKE